MRTETEIKDLFKKADETLTTEEIEFLYKRMPIDLLDALMKQTEKIKSFRKWLKWATEHPDRWNNSAPTRQCIYEKFIEIFGEESPVTAEVATNGGDKNDFKKR